MSTLFSRRIPWAFCAQVLMVSALASALVGCLDLPLLSAIQQIRHPAVQAAIRAGGWLGSGIHIWLIILPLYAAAVILQQPALRARVFGCLSSIVVAAVLSTCFKWTVARARPYSGLGPLSFFHWPRLLAERGSMFQSFPSGDVVVVAAAAWYLVLRSKRRGWRWVVLLVPLLTALSRVFLNKHWPSDTVFSFGLAFLAAALVTQ